MFEKVYLYESGGIESMSEVVFLSLGNKAWVLGIVCEYVKITIELEEKNVKEISKKVFVTIKPIYRHDNERTRLAAHDGRCKHWRYMDSSARAFQLQEANGISVAPGQPKRLTLIRGTPDGAVPSSSHVSVLFYQLSGNWWTQTVHNTSVWPHYFITPRFAR